MRSVMKNFVDLDNVVLCGDIPEWFTGDAIASPRFDGAAGRATFGSSRWCKWIDSIVKLIRICADPRVSERFVWLYDDTIFARPITAAELSVPRAGGLLCADPSKKIGGKWREVLRRTTEDLTAAGLPARNFSHHGPVVYEKSKLLQTIGQFLPYYKPRAIESLYLNHWTRPQDIAPLGRWLQYTKRPGPQWTPRPGAAICNFGTFSQSVERSLALRFPERCAVENDEYLHTPQTRPPMNRPNESSDGSDPGKLPPAFEAC